MADLVQSLYLGGLPSGLNLTITEVTPSVPDKQGWGVTFTGPKSTNFATTTINMYGTFDYLTNKLPYTVSTSTDGGHIGNVTYSGYSAFRAPWKSEKGGQVDITLRLQGTTTVNGKSYTIDKTGYINASTTDWGITERPDYSNVTCHWGEAPSVLSIKVPSTIAGMPENPYLVFAVGKDGNKIGVSSTTSKDTVDKVLDAAINGIFFVNEKLAGWAFGELLPF